MDSRDIEAKPLVLWRGLFYRGDTHVKTTFGDTEQIRLIQMLEDKQEHGECFMPQAREEGGFRIEFRCHGCNSECLEIKHVGTDMKLIGQKVTCFKCGKIHRIRLMDDGIIAGPFYLKVEKK